MWETRQRITSLLLVLVLLLLLLPMPATAAKRPFAEDLSPGYLLIGSYLIQKEALDKDVLNLAKASMMDSKQGMYYKSELVDDTWFDIKNASDIGAISDPSKGVSVSNPEINGMKITVWVYKKEGQVQIVPLMTKEEIDSQITELSDEKVKVTASNKDAVDKGNDSLATSTGLQIVQLQAEIDFLTALQKGDRGAVLQAVKNLSNPSSGLPDSAEQAQQAATADLQKQLADVQKELEKARAEDKQEALKQLAAELDQAKAQGDTAKAADIQALISEVQAIGNAVVAAKLDAQVEFVKADGLDALVEQLGDKVNAVQTMGVQNALAKLESEIALVQTGGVTALISALEAELTQAQDRGDQAVARVTADLLKAAKRLGTDQATALNKLQVELKVLKAQAASTDPVALLQADLQAVQKLANSTAATQLAAKATAVKARGDVDAVVKLEAKEADLLQKIKDLQSAGTSNQEQEQLVKQSALLNTMKQALKIKNTQIFTDSLGELNKVDAQLAKLRTPAAQKTGVETERKTLMEMYQQAETSKQTEVAAHLLVKLNELQAVLEDLQADEAAARTAALNTELAKAQSDVRAAMQEAKAGKPARLEAALVTLVDKEAELQAETDGLSDVIRKQLATKEKLEARLEVLNTLGKTQDMASVQNMLTNAEQDLQESQQQELFLQKDKAEAKQQEVLREIGQASEALTAFRIDTIEQIKQLEKQKYTKEQLVQLQAVQKQMEQEIGAQNRVLPVENVFSRDTEIKFQVPPVIVDGRALIHIRPVAEAFGSVVQWDNKSQSVTIMRDGDGKLIYCQIANPETWVNGQKGKLDVPPRLIAGRTFVPLRFVAESLGLTIKWDQDTQTIEIQGWAK